MSCATLVLCQYFGHKKSKSKKFKNDISKRDIEVATACITFRTLNSLSLVLISDRCDFVLVSSEVKVESPLEVL